MKCITIIPAYEPDSKLIKYVKDMLKKNFCEILIINDGSNIDKKHIFDELSKIKKCKVLHHEKNMGKGKALKTAFTYVINHKKNVDIVITADADGQHLVSDVYKMYKSAYKSQNDFILGVRSFDKNTPLRSMIGNKISTVLIKILHNINLKDTQTGLRLFRKNHLKWLEKIKGNRFEYELNVLLESKKENIKFSEVPIKTVYINDNKSSHFKPVKDAFRIFMQLIKGSKLYAASSLLSAGIDILLFTLLTLVFNNIYAAFVTITLSTGVSRIISSLVNYNLNLRIFTNNKNMNVSSVIRYYVLWSTQLIFSILLVSYFSTYVVINMVLTKIIIDTVLFIISYQVQLRWVFRK